ncbi:MAG: phosphatase PAP2 family protein [Methanohalobium sp.]|uniref:phosphatase PAP2 family protein n=1 Tax=Methanohalobium sp. TaxID=2837493 RepID=UPI00397E422D
MTTEYMLSIITLFAVILMSVVGYYVFIPPEFKNDHNKPEKRKLISDTLIYFIPISSVYIFINAEKNVANHLGIVPRDNYTRYLMMIEGDIVSYIQNIANPLLTYISSTVYLFGFPFLLVFTFFILAYTQKTRYLKEFTVAFILIYLIAYPFYVFFPVEVTGYTLENVEPLLYNLSPIISQGIRMSDHGLDNCFPSLHAALSIMTMLVVSGTEFKRYKTFVVGITAAILFTTLYLGIHWIIDLIAGFILAVTVYFITIRYLHLFQIPGKFKPRINHRKI